MASELSETEARSAGRARAERYIAARDEWREARAARAQGQLTETPALDGLASGLPAWEPPAEVVEARAHSRSAAALKAWDTRRRKASTST